MAHCDCSAHSIRTNQGKNHHKREKTPREEHFQLLPQITGTKMGDVSSFRIGALYLLVIVIAASQACDFGYNPSNCAVCDSNVEWTGPFNHPTTGYKGDIVYTLSFSGPQCSEISGTVMAPIWNQALGPRDIEVGPTTSYVDRSTGAIHIEDRYVNAQGVFLFNGHSSATVSGVNMVNGVYVAYSFTADREATSQCAAPYTEVGSGCYHVHSTAMTYAAGLAYCASIGGELASLQTQQEHDDIIAWLQTNYPNDEVMTGGVRIFGTSLIQWLDSSVTGWWSGAPDPACPICDYIVVWKTGGQHELGDVMAHEVFKPLCELVASPPPTGFGYNPAAPGTCDVARTWKGPFWVTRTGEVKGDIEFVLTFSGTDCDQISGTVMAPIWNQVLGPRDIEVGPTTSYVDRSTGAIHIVDRYVNAQGVFLFNGHSSATVSGVNMVNGVYVAYSFTADRQP